MKTTTTMLALALLFSTVACGGDEESNTGRFEGKSESEMFNIVKSALCDKFVACGSFTASECDAALDDSQHYQASISAEDRAQLDLCLTDIAAADCAGFAADSQGPEIASCAGVETYLDLK